MAVIRIDCVRSNRKAIRWLGRVDTRECVGVLPPSAAGRSALFQHCQRGDASVHKQSRKEQACERSSEIHGLLDACVMRARARMCRAKSRTLQQSRWPWKSPSSPGFASIPVSSQGLTKDCVRRDAAARRRCCLAALLRAALLPGCFAAGFA